MKLTHFHVFGGINSDQWTEHCPSTVNVTIFLNPIQMSDAQKVFNSKLIFQM